MYRWGVKRILPLVKRYAMRFLNERDVEKKQEKLLREKIKKSSSTTIGKKLGIRPDSSIEELPLTSYGFYRDYFENPHEGDFIYPLEDYVKVFTSGSMGKPKNFLVPKKGMYHNITTTGLSYMFICTHDGEKMTFEIGDTIYKNIPGGSYISGVMADMFKGQSNTLVRNVPEKGIPYKEKVDYFIKNYRDIDVAYMTVTTLLDDVYPRIGEPFKLKAFITQDRSASVLREEIKEVVGTYPKTTYGSTETFLSGMASIEHPGSFFMDWRGVYCEFIPEGNYVGYEENVILEPPETVPLMEVQPGKRYQFVVTPYKNDLNRYITTDVFECIDIGDSILGMELPIFSFYSRGDKLVSVHNFTRISEEELLSVLKEAEIPFVDFTIRVELEGSREYMTMYLELSSPMDTEEVYKRLNDELLKVDKDWRDLSSFMDYTPLKIQLLPKGQFRKYLSRKVGMPRIERIGMREDRFTELLKEEA
jgi:phenylacetate-coenzyme A ligase PaaK-like adenylate-forming protein